MLKRSFARLAVVGGVALAAVSGSLATAEASWDATLIGYGYVTSGTGVWCVQHALNAAGAHLSEDSQFGPKTKNAVVAFQQQHGLQADGIVGRYTGSALLNPLDVDTANYCFWHVPTNS